MQNNWLNIYAQKIEVISKDYQVNRYDEPTMKILKTVLMNSFLCVLFFTVRDDIEICIYECKAMIDSGIKRCERELVYCRTLSL